MWYALIVAGLSLVGAALPLSFRPGHAQLQIYLSVAAGALLGAALFHLLPESSEHIHGSFGLPTALGVAVIFFLQRYVAPHSHEPAGGHGHGGHASHDAHHGDEAPRPELGGEAHGHHAHVGDDVHHHERHRATGPFLGGAVAIAALSIHSFFDGVAIGAAIDGLGESVALAVFLSVLIHKPMDGLSVSVLLLNAGTGRGTLWLVQIVYALLVPIGAAAFMATRGAITDPSPMVGYTLAFSAGTFLAIALTDLLPELHFHSHDRHKLSAALLLGLGIMWVTSLFGHAHGQPEGAHQHSEQPVESKEPHDGHDHAHD